MVLWFLKLCSSVPSCQTARYHIPEDHSVELIMKFFNFFGVVISQTGTEVFYILSNVLIIHVIHCPGTGYLSIFLFYTASTLTLGPTQTPIQCVLGSLLGREVARA